MLSVGIDAHHRSYSLCILDEEGSVVKEGTVKGSVQDVSAWLRQIKRPFAVCYEASLGYGMPHDELAPLAGRIAVAHPARVRPIFRSKRKNDRIDARKLAKCLYLDEVRVPAQPVREWRVLIEHRRRTVDRRTAVKNGVRALLRSQDVASPRGRGLRTRGGLAWLATLEFKSPMTAPRLRRLLGEIANFDVIIRETERLLDAEAARRPRVALLRTIPGVGPRTAEAVVAYVDDPHRFGSAAEAASYFGLVPGLDESAGTSRHGRITRQGPATVRKLMTEASWRAVMCSPTVRRFFTRIKGGQKDRTGKALVATARRLVCVMAAMLKSGQPWRESPEEGEKAFDGVKDTLSRS